MTKKKIFFVLAIFIILLTSLFIEKDIINKILYPKKYSDYVEIYSKEFGLDENLVYSVIKVESKFRKDAIFDPEINIKIGCWYLNKLYKEFGRLDLVIAAYNGGSGNVNKWLNDDSYSKDGKSLDLIPFEETSMYVKKITKNYKMYNKLYSKEG